MFKTNVFCILITSAECILYLLFRILYYFSKVIENSILKC